MLISALWMDGPNGMDTNPYTAPGADSGNSVSVGRWQRRTVGFLLFALVMLFVLVPLLLVLLVLVACNAVAFPVLLLSSHARPAGLAFLTAALMLVALLLTDWGFSMPQPRIRIAWSALIPACVLQLLLVTMPLWFSRHTEMSAATDPGGR